MEEVKALFYSDVKEKSITAHGAKNIHRQRDYNKQYSNRELKKKNGGTYSMNFNKYMSFKKFRSLPENMQKDYIIHLVEEYDIGRATFAKMWNVAQSTTWKMFKEFDIPSPDYDLGKERLFLEKFRPEVLVEKVDAKKPKKRRSKKSTEVSAKLADTDKPVEIKPIEKPRTPLFEIDPTLAIDQVIINTDVYFEDIDSMTKFFMRFIPIKTKIDLNIEVNVIKEGESK